VIETLLAALRGSYADRLIRRTGPDSIPSGIGTVSQKLKPASGLSGKVVAQRVLVAYYNNWHGRNPKLTGNGQPDEILRKEGQSWGSRRDSHEPKTTVVKTIRQGGDAKTAALSCERNGNLRGKRRDPWHGPTHRQKRWLTCVRWLGCDWFTSASKPGPQVSGRNHWLKRANKPHPKIQVP